MEEFYMAFAEKTVVGAGFLYMLYYQVKNMEVICQNLSEFGKALNKVTETLLKIDLRVEMLEEKLRELRHP